MISMVGDWAKFGKTITALADSRLIPLMKVRIDESGKMFLQTLIQHVQNQNLDWLPLSEETVRIKGNNIVYIDTGTLVNNLVSEEVIDKADTYAVFVGAPNTLHTPSGQTFSEVMLYMEYGTFQNPARPLIQPTFEELKKRIAEGLKQALKDALQNNYY